MYDYESPFHYHNIKAYYIQPPEDNFKWARICEHIIRHYNEGWADGYNMGIKYWEIWCEPDNGRDNSDNQLMCYYDAQIGVSYYAGMFNPLTKEPFPLYYAFKAFNELYLLGNECYCSFEDCDGLYQLTAEKDGAKAILITNESDVSKAITTNLTGDFDVFVIDDIRLLEKIDMSVGNFILAPGTAVLIKTPI